MRTRGTTTASPFVSTTTPATAEETVTLLTLVQLLRSRSGPLNELLSIAMDPEPYRPSVCRRAAPTYQPIVGVTDSEVENLLSIAMDPEPHQPSVCRSVAPIYQPVIGVTDAEVENHLNGQPWPPAVSDMLYNERSRQRRGSRSPDFAPDIDDSNPWQPEPTPSFNDDGSEDSKSPKYSWLHWYKMTAKGAKRWKFDP